MLEDGRVLEDDGRGDRGRGGSSVCSRVGVVGSGGVAESGMDSKGVLSFSVSFFSGRGSVGSEGVLTLAVRSWWWISSVDRDASAASRFWLFMLRRLEDLLACP